jgi:L-cysteine desulfidase
MGEAKMEQHKLEQKKQIFFKNLLKDLVSPAYGCTEIGCVALACSAAAEHLKGPVVSAKLHVSSYIYRNDANVGVPKLGQVGIKTIAAAGFIVKQSKKKLLVLSSITDAQAKLAKQNSKQNFIDIIIEKHRNPVYAKVIAKDKFNNTCEVLIERKHDNIKRITLNNKLVAVNTKTKASNVHTYKYNVDDISLNDVYYGVQNFTINDVKFLRDGLMMNKKVMNYGEKHREGFTKVAMAGYSFNETN